MVLLLHFTFPASRWKHLALEFGLILVTFGGTAKEATAPTSLSPASLKWKNDTTTGNYCLSVSRDLPMNTGITCPTIRKKKY